MHQIRFRLGLRSRPRWGSSQRSPRLPICILGVLLLRGGREGKRKGGEGNGGEVGGRERERKGEGEGKEAEGKPSRIAPPPRKNFLATPLYVTDKQCCVIVYARDVVSADVAASR